MRSIFGVLSLLVVVAIIGVLAKKQTSAIGEVKVPQVAGETPAITLKLAPHATGLQQSQKIQQQFKSAAEAAAQENRTLPDEK